jgi:hypothetical protein
MWKSADSKASVQSRRLAYSDKPSDTLLIAGEGSREHVKVDVCDATQRVVVNDGQLTLRSVERVFAVQDDTGTYAGTYCAAVVLTQGYCFVVRHDAYFRVCFHNWRDYNECDHLRILGAFTLKVPAGFYRGFAAGLAAAHGSSSASAAHVPAACSQGAAEHASASAAYVSAAESRGAAASAWARSAIGLVTTTHLVVIRRVPNQSLNRSLNNVNGTHVQSFRLTCKIVPHDIVARCSSGEFCDFVEETADTVAVCDEWGQWRREHRW